MFHLLFEQSGTFKNVLKKLGYQAKDYDILNDFKEKLEKELYEKFCKNFRGNKFVAR